MRRLVRSLAALALACAEDTPPSAEGSEQGEAATETETETETEGETEPLEPICASPLSEAITADDVAAHFAALDAIASEHGGNRAAGTPGYEASAAYVEAQLQAAGYATARWPFVFDRYELLGPPQLATLSDPPIVYTHGEDYGVPNWSPSGSVSAPIEPVDLALGLANQSTSGCEPEDFAEFTPGNIALIQRGTCKFIDKAKLAEDAGALGVILFNQGDTDARTGLLSGSLGGQNTLTIPVVFATYALGAELDEAAALAPVVVELGVDAGVLATETFNVFAETQTGDPSRVIMLGAHLDSVPAGPGINDNGSGSATLIELAGLLAACSPNHKVRFAWWGGEEWGLHGSRQYVEGLSDAELASIALYLNFDMLASPNFVRYVHHGGDGPEGSTLLYDAFVEWFDAHGLEVLGAGFAGNSDFQPFVDAGVPSSGLATGARGTKSEAQAQTYGGVAGEAYDACYHLACDAQSNYADAALEHNAKAAAYVLEKWARDLGPLAAQAEIVRAPLPTDITTAAVHECGHTHE